MAFFRKLSRFRSFPGKVKLSLIEAALLLAVSRMAVGWLPFSWYRKLLNQRKRAPERVKAADQATLVNWSIAAAGRHLPWNSSCLVQATAARWMLSRRGLSSTLFLGTRKGETGTPDFHAWLTCEDQVICGHHEREQYTILHSFGK